MAPYVALGALGALVALLAAAPALASPPGSTSSAIAAKRAQASQVLDEVNGLDASLGKADELLNLANLRLAGVHHRIAVNRHELHVARHNLVASRKTIAQRLVTLYTAGSTSTLELILGAKSLDDILNQLDTEHRVSSADAEVIGQVRVFESSVKQHARALRLEQRQVTRLVAMRRQQQRAIEVRLGERKHLLDSLNGEIAQLVQQQELEQERAAAAAAQRARARITELQTQQEQDAANAVVGASASTPEGSDVPPPSSYGGVAGIAMRYLGTPYVWGGESPSGFDCSGLVAYAYAQLGVTLPHSSYAMWDYGVSVPRDQLEPGDLVFFNGLGHVGIYIGGGQYVEAPHTGAYVQVSSLDSGWAAASYVGARRLLG